MFISSPSKSALYGEQTHSLNRNVLQGMILDDSTDSINEAGGTGYGEVDGVEGSAWGYVQGQQARCAVFGVLLAHEQVHLYRRDDEASSLGQHRHRLAAANDSHRTHPPLSTIQQTTTREQPQRDT